MIRKNKHVESADFCRDYSNDSIEVVLSGGSVHFSLFSEIIAHCAEVLSEIELEEVISILSRKKEAMLKQRNFPLVCEEMLSDLIGAQRERYGVHAEKKVKSTRWYGVSIDKLEEILGLYANLEDAHVTRVYVGTDKLGLDRIDLGKNNRELFVQFREAGEEDE